jgi:hypothetical protein
VEIASGPRFDRSTQRFEYGFASEDVEAHDECYDEHLRDADIAHQTRDQDN